MNYLLGHKEVGGPGLGPRPGGKAAFLMFDDETEELADELGLDVAFPPASLRHRLDSKIETTRLGNEAGVPERPQHDGRAATTYPELLALARGRAGSGTTSWCRRRTGTRARRRSSSPTARIGTRMRGRSRANSSR